MGEPKLTNTQMNRLCCLASGPYWYVIGSSLNQTLQRKVLVERVGETVAGRLQWKITERGRDFLATATAGRRALPPEAPDA